jgi:hypothetical protein
MTEATTRDPWRIHHGGKAILLNGPASQSLDLEGSGAEATAKELVWEPKNKQANEIEVRARLVSSSGNIGDIPIVRWFSETSHGDSVWREPAPTLPIIAGTPVVDHSLPARGMSFRVTARQFRIGFRNQGMITGAPLVRTKVQVSILPGWGAFPPIYPYQQIVLPFGATVQQPFPITAREWKLTDITGQPLALGAVAITFVGILGALFGITDAALYDDFAPIPHDAAAFVASAPCYVSYR